MAVIIMRGPSGGGKSTFTRKIMERDLTDMRGQSTSLDFMFDDILSIEGRISVSADKFFVRQLQDGGTEYHFERSMIGDAHGACLREFTDAVQSARNDSHVIVVDNTNTTVGEITPYAALANAYGHDLHIVEIECAWYIAQARNVHGVPQETVLRQSKNIDTSRNLIMQRYPSYHKFRTQ